MEGLSGALSRGTGVTGTAVSAEFLIYTGTEGQTDTDKIQTWMCVSTGLIFAHFPALVN